MFGIEGNSRFQFSVRDGVFMPFIYKGHQVVVHNSSWSFREKIWVDDELVFNAMGYSFTSVREIEIAGDKVVIEFGYRKKRAAMFIEATLDGQRVYAYEQDLGGDFTWRTILAIALLGTAGGLFGYYGVSGILALVAGN